MTLPWDENGYRVLPAAAYMDYTERTWRAMRRLRAHDKATRLCLDIRIAVS
jgi:hypothetical protein